MNCYETNKEAMKERYSEIFDYMEEEISDELQIENIRAKDGNHALSVTKDGKIIRLNSVYRPLAEVEKWAEQYEFKNIEINLFMFGFGNGLFVRELLKNAAKDTSIFLWEPDASIFHYVMEHENLTDIFRDERFYFYLGKRGFGALKEALEHTVSWHNIKTQIRCQHIGYQRLYEEEYDMFFDLLDKANSDMIVKRDTNAFFAHRAVLNVLDNIKYIKDSNYITELVEKLPDDIPAIVVAAGPSLDKNIDLLKEADGRAFIIATDTAVKILESKGLPYDCIVTMDPAKPAWYLTDYPGCKEKPLFCGGDSESEILKFHQGRKIWTSGSIYIDALYGSFDMHFPHYTVGGSVATSATMLAQQIGVKNIILIGQDLAYTGEHTHAGGYDDHIRNEEKFIEMIDGIDGEKVKSRGDWTFFLHWYEEFIETHDDITVIDATEGGALIHGSEIMTFREAIDTYCEGKEFSFSAVMEQLPKTFDLMDYKPMQEELLHMRKGFKNISERSKEGKKEAEEFLAAGKKLSQKKHDRILKDIKKINNFLWKQSGYALIDTYTCDLEQHVLNDVSEITGDSYQDETATVKTALLIYESYIKAVEELQEKLEQSLEEV